MDLQNQLAMWNSGLSESEQVLDPTHGATEELEVKDTLPPIEDACSADQSVREIAATARYMDYMRDKYGTSAQKHYEDEKNKGQNFMIFYVVDHVLYGALYQRTYSELRYEGGMRELLSPACASS